MTSTPPATTRVVHLTAQQLEQQRRDVIADTGISYDWLHRYSAEHGHRCAVEWLEDHTFHDVAAVWRHTSFLLGER